MKRKGLVKVPPLPLTVVGHMNINSYHKNEEKEASISLSKGPLQSISLAGKTNKRENREEKERGKERWRVSAEKDAFFCDFDRGAHLGSFQRITHHFF